MTGTTLCNKISTPVLIECGVMEGKLCVHHSHVHWLPRNADITCW